MYSKHYFVIRTLFLDLRVRVVHNVLRHSPFCKKGQNISPYNIHGQHTVESEQKYTGSFFFCFDYGLTSR